MRSKKPTPQSSFASQYLSRSLSFSCLNPPLPLFSFVLFAGKEDNRRHVLRIEEINAKNEGGNRCLFLPPLTEWMCFTEKKLVKRNRNGIWVDCVMAPISISVERGKQTRKRRLKMDWTKDTGKDPTSFIDRHVNRYVDHFSAEQRFRQIREMRFTHVQNAFLKIIPFSIFSFNGILSQTSPAHKKIKIVYKTTCKFNDQKRAVQFRIWLHEPIKKPHLISTANTHTDPKLRNQNISEKIREAKNRVKKKEKPFKLKNVANELYDERDVCVPLSAWGSLTKMAHKKKNYFLHRFCFFFCFTIFRHALIIRDSSWSTIAHNY